MLREMTAAQLDEWIAFYRLEPWGLEVIDNLAASIKATLINLNRSKKQSPLRDWKKLLLWPEEKNMVDAELENDDGLGD